MTELTKAQKIRRRTLVGGSLALVTAALLTLTNGENGSLIVHYFAGALLLGSVYEAARTTKDFALAGVPLLVGAAVAWVMTLDVLHGSSSAGELEALSFDLLIQMTSASIVAVGGLSALLQVIAPHRRVWLIMLSLPLLLGGSESILAVSYLPLASFGLFFLVILGAKPVESRRPFRVILEDIARVVWFVPALCGLALLHREFGQAGLISLVLLSKVGDIFGYFGGSFFGKHHPFPQLSPGKTSEGFACSLLGGVAVGAALAHWGALPVEEVSLLQGALLGGVMNVAAQVGDLIESMVKRRAKMKDSGTLFGPSGGFLDLLDSFFLTVPVALVIGLLTRG